MSSNTRILPCIALALVVQAIPCAGQTADWEQRAEARAKEIIAKNGPGTQSALKEELLAMYERDQGMRTRMREAGPPREREFDAELARTDRQITRELRKVVSRFGWSGHRNSGFIRELHQKGMDQSQMGGNRDGKKSKVLLVNRCGARSTGKRSGQLEPPIRRNQSCG